VKHVTFADKSLLVGDEIADLLLEYAALLASNRIADTVEVHAFGADGDEVVAKLLLGESAPLMSETTHTSLPDPDNLESEVYVREQIERLTSTPRPVPVDQSELERDSSDDLHY
jgi:hypothetical protein